MTKKNVTLVDSGRQPVADRMDQQVKTTRPRQNTTETEDRKLKHHIILMV